MTARTRPIASAISHDRAASPGGASRPGRATVRAEGISGRTAAPRVLVDAHVHFYPGFDEARFFDGALANVGAAAAGLGLASGTPGWLLLTETARDHAFADFAARAGRGGDGWSFRATDEDCSLVVCRDGQDVLGLVAGRQIVTREGLEVLALGTTATPADGAGLDETLERVRAAGALAVLPWGFGKWTSRRGALVEERIRGEGRGVFLGDNGGRLAAGPRPRLLDLAESRGLVVLPGSDPLPFPGQEGRVASFGFVLDAPADAARPAAGLMAGIGALAASPPAYGRTTGIAPFVRNQVLMQLRKYGISK